MVAVGDIFACKRKYPVGGIVAQNPADAVPAWGGVLKKMSFPSPLAGLYLGFIPKHRVFGGLLPKNTQLRPPTARRETRAQIRRRRRQPPNSPFCLFPAERQYNKNIVVSQRQTNPLIAQTSAPHHQNPTYLAAADGQQARFLSSLRGVKRDYKRYIGSPLRYAGGKSLAVGHVISHIPTGVRRLVSPFIGGGSVETACATELGMDVLGYDIFDILTNYWQYQIARPVDLYRALAKITPDRENYARVKKELRAHWRGEKRLGKKQLAINYYFNHNLSYGPGFLGWMSRIYEEPDRYVRMLKKVRNFRPGAMRVECASFEDAIAQHPRDFLYCDPPYFLGGDSKMFRGIYPQRNFPVHHNGFSHEKLRDILHAHKGGWILSYNDCTEVRKWYKDFRIVEVSWQYTLGQGETRVGFNRVNGLNGATTHIKKSHELLIVKDPQ